MIYCGVLRLFQTLIQLHQLLVNGQCVFLFESSLISSSWRVAMANCLPNFSSVCAFIEVVDISIHADPKYSFPLVVKGNTDPNSPGRVATFQCGEFLCWPRHVFPEILKNSQFHCETKYSPLNPFSLYNWSHAHHVHQKAQIIWLEIRPKAILNVYLFSDVLECSSQ